jgi:hypothetical protein
MKFTNPSEVRAVCRALDAAASMRVDSYSELIAECSFPELHYVECQLIDDKGHACRQKFGKGWVARRKDGVEVLIGGSCAKRHFLGAGADSLKQFKADAARLVRQNKVNEALSRLNEFHSNAEYGRKLQDLSARQQALCTQIYAAREALPHAVLERLKRLARGSSRSVPGEVRHTKKIERNGHVVEVPDWRPLSLGVISNPEIILLGAVLSVGRTISAATDALMASVDYIKDDLQALTDRLNALLDADRGASELLAAEASFNLFMQPGNWRVLSWLAIREEDQRMVVSKMLELEGKPAKPHDAKQAIAQWSLEIRAANGGREFRAVQ